MRIDWADQAWDDVLHWSRNDRKILARIVGLIEAIRADPFVGIGKPEALKGNLSGWWSRRITDEHRLVYRVQGTTIAIAQARFHY